MKRITVAKGDGIGPEIMDATLDIIKAAGAQIEIDEIEVGEKVYLSGNTSGIAKSSWDTIRRNKVFLKAPITTPQGGGYKSLNVTTRKMLGLYSNVRPCKSLHPFVSTKHPDMDVVIIRENEEDLYAGIEHQQTDEVVQCLKLISRPGCEKIVRYAFEYARFQEPENLTIISTNFGDMGNAHSEYLSALSETGFVGFVLFILFVGCVFYYLLIFIQRARGVNHSYFIIGLGMLFSVSTYFIHAFLNNFLDTDKAAVPVYGMIAVLFLLNSRLTAQPNGRVQGGSVDSAHAMDLEM